MGRLKVVHGYRKWDGEMHELKTLVIGSAGFIGSHLTQLLADRGHTVAGFDLRSPAQTFGVSQFWLANLLDRDALAAALTGVETVIHLAAVHADVGHEEHEYWETNEAGTRLLTTIMAERGVRRLLFVSSMAVYGERSDVPDESSAPRPSSVYGSSKVAAEAVVRAWAEGDPRREAMIVRPAVVYGERHLANMHTLIRQIDSGWFCLFGSGANVKATAYVENLTEALIFCLQRMKPGVELYNYADKPDLTSREIVMALRQRLGRRPAPLRLPLWLGVLAATPFDFAARCLSRPLPISSARVRKLAQSTPLAANKIRAAGFQQPVTAEEGLRRMVEFYRASETP